jgi:hypothetical protein
VTVDKAIRRLRLPEGSLKKGENSLLIKAPFGLLTSVERVYIKGSFGVPSQGTASNFGPTSSRQALIWRLDATRTSLLCWRHYVPLFHHSSIYCTALVALCIPRFSSPVLAVVVHGTRQGLIAFEPYLLKLGTLEPGHHTLEITCFGNRSNALSHLHLPERVSP